MRLELLGPFRLSGGRGGAGQLPKKVQGLLAYLGMHGGQPIPREQLAALMWSDNGEDQARHSLRQSLVSLRAALAAAGPKLIFADSATVGINVSGQLSVDVREFELLARSTNPEELSAAAKLYRGEFLSGLRVYCEPFSEWVSMERRRLASAMSDVLYRLAGAQVDNIEAAIAAAQQLAAFEPLREEGQRLLIRLLAMAGRRDAALKQYGLCATILDRELGVAPEPETAALAEAVRRGKLASDTVPLLSAGKLTSSTAREDPAPAQHDSDNEDAVSRCAASDKPSVAVLPFTNLSGDPQQDYFTDGITEDIITELSRFSELLVIARNSSFQYKGKAVDIRRVGRELGARYVLEGGIRRGGDRVRITAQLVDAETGAHRWAERYDRELRDVFAVQDEVARAIVATLASHVNRAETERALLKPPAAWGAYEYYLRGAEAFFLHFSRRTKDSLYEARHLLEQSLAIDPDYARAAAALSETHVYAYIEPHDGDYLSPAALDHALELAEAAARVDPRLPQARAQLGMTLHYKGHHDAALVEFDQAFALNPNFIYHRYAYVLTCAGEPAKAIEVVEANIRLDPFAPPIFSSGFMGLANYMLKRYPEAVRWLRECALRLPNMQVPRVWLASAYAQLGQLEEARKEAAEVVRINPDFTIQGYKRLWAYKDPKDAEHRLEGLRKAGLPER